LQHVPAHNLHLTLAFAGAVTASTQTCLEQQAARVRVPAFTLQVTTTGYFARAQTLWLGLSEQPAALQVLAEQLRDALAWCGLEPEARPFQPHISIARHCTRAVAEAAVDPVAWSVSRFHLVESVSGAGGVQYRPICSWKLEGHTASMG
jgi:2'-5' RNA ligase